MSDLTTSSLPLHQRQIRSFVRREGRLTRGQQQALTTLSTKFCPAGTDELQDARLLFHQPELPLHIEIGCGTGETLLALAQQCPDHNYLGFEVYRPGVGSLLLQLEKLGIGNVRVLAQDVVGLMNNVLAAGSVTAFYIFFPDPWPKKRHHKRRLIQPAFTESLHAKLGTKGTVFVATDDASYAAEILDTFEAGPYRNLAGPGLHSERPAWRPLTRFERRGLRLGHKVYDFAFAAS